MDEARAIDGAWRPSGVTALLTDFGLRDPYVGQMHAVILARHPTGRIVDLTHHVPAQDVRVAAFFLARSRAYFAPGTVFVAVVDPGVGTDRRILLAREGTHAYLAPDNGLLPAALSDAASYQELDVERCALPRRSRTFHGRDVFAPVAAALASGALPDDLARPLSRAPQHLAAPRARRVEEDLVEARVLLVDHFGNVVLDVAPEDLPSDRNTVAAGRASRWRAEVKGRAIEFAGTYGEVRSGELLALVSSFGSIELARRDGSAASELGLSPGDPVVLRRIAC